MSLEKSVFVTLAVFVNPVSKEIIREFEGPKRGAVFVQFFRRFSLVAAIADNVCLVFRFKYVAHKFGIYGQWNFLPVQYFLFFSSSLNFKIREVFRGKKEKFPAHSVLISAVWLS